MTPCEARAASEGAYSPAARLDRGVAEAPRERIRKSRRLALRLCAREAFRVGDDSRARAPRANLHIITRHGSSYMITPPGGPHSSEIQTILPSARAAEIASTWDSWRQTVSGSRVSFKPGRREAAARSNTVKRAAKLFVLAIVRQHLRRVGLLDGGESLLDFQPVEAVARRLDEVGDPARFQEGDSARRHRVERLDQDGR